MHIVNTWTDEVPFMLNMNGCLDVLNIEVKASAQVNKLTRPNEKIHIFEHRFPGNRIIIILK